MSHKNLVPTTLPLQNAPILQGLFDNKPSNHPIPSQIKLDTSLFYQFIFAPKEWDNIK